MSKRETYSGNLDPLLADWTKLQRFPLQELRPLGPPRTRRDRG